MEDILNKNSCYEGVAKQRTNGEYKADLISLLNCIKQIQKNTYCMGWLCQLVDLYGIGNAVIKRKALIKWWRWS